MKTTIILVASAMLLSIGAAQAARAAAPPTAGQKAAFVKECLRNSGGNSTLCNCKAEQAMKLIDQKFMDIVLATMNGKTLPVEQSRPYAVYISESNAVCAPGM